MSLQMLETTSETRARSTIPAWADLVRTHYGIQTGRFISCHYSAPDALVLSSEISLVPMWNHAAWLGDETTSLINLVHDLSRLWPHPDRRPALYVIPQNREEEVDHLLGKEGYERFDQEAWMIHSLTKRPASAPGSRLEIVRASSGQEAEHVVGVFRAAYQITGSKYGAELRRQIVDPSEARDIFHYLGCTEGKPVCLATLIQHNGAGSIYNVGTIPNARGRGYAGELLAFLINQSASAGLGWLALQVDADGPAERLYARLGFQREFLRFGYRLKDWKPGVAPKRVESSAQVPQRSPRQKNGPAPATEELYEGIGSLVSRRAVERSDQPAVVFSPDEPGGSTEILTYGELNDRANRLAHALREAGVMPNGFVGVFLERSPEMIVALLGIWKAGAAALPLDPAYPMGRLAFILRETGPKVVLTQKLLRARLAELDCQTLAVEPASEITGKIEAPPCAATATDLAYIIYTSGSTGEPKGVLIPNAALLEHALECQSFYEITADDRVLQFSSLNFDAALEQIVPALISGACLVVRGEEIWDVHRFTREVVRHGVTLLDLPTAYWHQLSQDWANHPERVPDNRVRLVIVGGEAMQPETLRLWRRTPFRHVRLLNAYGPTEATITATTFEVTPAFLERDALARVPIGRPRGTRRICLLDENGREVPAGGIGELCIGGRLVALGYLNRPKLTAAKFITDPDSELPSQRLYKTGDLGRLLADGDLEFLGRIDDQVKIRGFRVELGEIESNLLGHPAVREAAVIVRESAAGERKLAAYVVGKMPPGPTAKELRRFLRQTLPEYMIPSHFTVLESLPLLPSGKVAKRALAGMTPEGMESQGALKGASDPLELRLQLLFERILNRRPIGVDASFFELGGDSLQALELLLQVEQITGKNLPLGTLYQTATVEGLAGLIKSDLPMACDSSLVPLQTRGTRPALFLIHTTPGDILAYGNLIFHLDSNQPCYGLQSLGLCREGPCHERIEEMARYYLDLIQTIQPRGPYYLAGWCYGGIVGVEIAHQFRLRGEAVAFLGLLETVAPRPSFAVYEYYLHRWSRALRMKPRQWLPYIRAKLRYLNEARRANKLRFQRVTVVPGEMRAACEQKNRKLDRLEEVYRSNMAALNRYRPRPYPGAVTLFNAAEIDAGVVPDPDYGWPGLAAQIEIHVVPGDHDTMLTEPHVAVLAEKFETALQAAQHRHGVASPADWPEPEPRLLDRGVSV